MRLSLTVQDAVFYAVMLLLAEVVALALWGLTTAGIRVASDLMNGRPLPGITVFVFSLQRFYPFLPIPWIFFPFTSLIQRRRSTRMLIYFSATLTLALVTFAVLVATAITLTLLDVAQAAGS